jgi:hypothetical protein
MSLPPRTATLIAGGLLTVAVAAPASLAHASAAHRAAVGPAAPAALAAPPPLLRQAVADLPAAEEARTGYKRTSFKHWTDSDSDGCSARNEVLLAEAIDKPTEGERCQLTGGAWYSRHDVVVTAAGQLDVDHLICVPATQM